jgi:aminoglycoside phosphotransferase
VTPRWLAEPEGWQPLFFEAYGIEPDPDRIRLYRALWNDEP